ncbi:MAG TPA: VOC family protein [Nitrospiria bacterium]
MKNHTIFHLAFPVNHPERTKEFYVKGLGCTLGRESKTAIILELNGNQIVAHLTQEPLLSQKGIYPRHFGLIFKSEKDWKAMAERAKEKGLKFRMEPRHRFPGTRIEHGTFVLEDPSHNLLEFKYYKYESAIFGEHEFSKVGDKGEAD